MNDKLKLDKLLPSVVPPNIETLRAHPIAAAFPMMSKADFEALKASIADQGFQDHEPIVLYGEPRMILDGRNRLKACLEVGHKRRPRSPLALCWIASVRDGSKADSCWSRLWGQPCLQNRRDLARS
jgi:hypothetical protein